MVLLLDASPPPQALLLSSPVLCASTPESNKYAHLCSLLPSYNSGSFTQRITHNFLSLVKGQCWAAQWPETSLRRHLWLTSSFNAGIWWRRFSPVPTGIFHVRSVRSKVLQIRICTDHSKFPADKATFIYIRKVSQWNSHLIFIQTHFLWHTQKYPGISVLLVIHKYLCSFITCWRSYEKGSAEIQNYTGTEIYPGAFTQLYIRGKRHNVQGAAITDLSIFSSLRLHPTHPPTQIHTYDRNLQNGFQKTSGISSHTFLKECQPFIHWTIL